MSASRNDTEWAEANQRYLVAAVGVVRARVKQHATGPGPNASSDTAAVSIHTAEETQSAALAAMPAPPALDAVCRAFGLSTFERDLLVLCAGVELDGALGADCAAAHADSRATFASFSLALSVLRDPHWSAVSPVAPLRRWRLIELHLGESLMASPLRIDERLLHLLAGVDYPDPRLAPLIEPLPATGDTTASCHALAMRIAGHWSSMGTDAQPVVQLCGDDGLAKRAAAVEAFAVVGLQAHALCASDIPVGAAERQALARLWEREAALTRSGLLIEIDDAATADAIRTVLAFLETARGAILLSARDPVRDHHRALIRYDLTNPTAEEQSALWLDTLGPMAVNMNGELDAVVGQFNLSTRAIRAAAADARDAASPVEAPLARSLWDACRTQARPRLDGLARRITTVVTWDDLVLPAPQLQTLREVAAHVRQRFTVYQKWGLGKKNARGLGISALFSGDSGTGKTMAAEVLANELRLDLYHIDLSSVVSKYIGETEKNLRRVFDAAEAGGAVLLFDEADALFGKRSEVKDSHDRYANIEVSYLLQRIEAYRGLAILTTNLRHAIDAAFLRRIRFVVPFPFPDVAQRAEIWRRIFPESTPTEGLEVGKLARLNAAGGSIRNVALNAAFLAADAGEPVRMTHLLRSARTEYAKLERPLSESETGGWV